MAFQATLGFSYQKNHSTLLAEHSSPSLMNVLRGETSWELLSYNGIAVFLHTYPKYHYLSIVK